MRLLHKPLLAVVALLIFSVAAALLWPEPAEPVYKGKRLSFWVEQMPVVIPDGRPPADCIEAVLRTGTNGLPYYVQWIQYSPSPTRAKARKVINAVLHRMNPRWTSLDHRALRAEGALEAFGVLQTRARGASEELEKIAKSPEPLIRGNAEAALRRINTPAFLPPVFEEMKFDLRGTTNQNRSGS